MTVICSLRVVMTVASARPPCSELAVRCSPSFTAEVAAEQGLRAFALGTLVPAHLCKQG